MVVEIVFIHKENPHDTAHKNNHTLAGAPPDSHFFVIDAI
jgi:hypothetical protein